MSNETEIIDDETCFSKERAYYSLLVVISFFIICINFDVIYTMATNKTLQTKRNAFLISLSVSDLLNGSVSIPLHIASNCYYPRSEVLILAQAICFRFVAISTMLNILLITVERYFGIIYPIKYQFILTKARTSILITCTWATSVSSALVSYSWLMSVHAGDEDIPMRERQFERAYFIFSFVAFFLLPLVIMSVLYTKMFRAISRARNLASKAQMYLKSCGRFQSPVPRSPIEIRVTRPRSVTVGFYCNRDQSRGQSSSLPQSPVVTRNRSRSHGSYGDHLTVHGNSQSPVRVETMVTHSESRVQSTIALSPPQSPTRLPMTEIHRPVCCQISCPENTSAHAQDQPQSLYLNLPLNEAARYAKHHGSFDRFLSSNHRFMSTRWLSNSTQAINKMKSARPLEKYQSDSVITSRERTSFSERLFDACETAASKLRMRRQGINEDRWGQSRIKQEHRVLLVFVTMISVFALSWISWYILVLDFTYSIYIPSVVLDCFDILRFSVSFVNPILYTFFKKDFRIAFKKSLRKFSTDQQKARADIKEKQKKPKCDVKEELKK